MESPRIIVGNILNKMKQVSLAIIESVTRMPTVPKTTFLVRGDSKNGAEMKTYCVHFGPKKTVLFVSVFLQLSIV